MERAIIRTAGAGCRRPAQGALPIYFRSACFSSSAACCKPSTADPTPDAASGASSSAFSRSTNAPIPLSSPHKFFLGLGSALASLVDPSRGDQIALLSELSAEPFNLARMRDQMLQSEEGRRVLLDRPQINTQTVNMDYLRSLPRGTFGNEYTRWLDWCGVGPDTRAEVLHVDDPTLRYIMARNRQSHDMHHLLCLMPVSHLGETVVKIFEASHFGLPVSYLSALAGPLRLSSEEKAKLFGLGWGGGQLQTGALANGLAAWAWRQGQVTRPLINVYWEKRWEQDFSDLRRELGFDQDPPFRVEYNVSRKRKDDLSRGRWASKVIEAQRDAAA